MDTSLYIPITTDSLAHYFNRALVLPAYFYKNKKEDIQNRISNSILLSKKRWIKNCDCSIEVIFTSDELKTLKILDNNFFSIDKPIPVSRIKKVCFTDKKQMETTIWNINNGAGFVPEQILSVENVKEEDLPQEAKELIEDGLYSKEEVLKMYVNRDRVDELLVIRPLIRKVDGKPMVDFDDKEFELKDLEGKVVEIQKEEVINNETEVDDLLNELENL